MVSHQCSVYIAIFIFYFAVLSIFTEHIKHHLGHMSKVLSGDEYTSFVFRAVYQCSLWNKAFLIIISFLVLRLSELRSSFV